MTDDPRFVQWASQDAADAAGPPISMPGFHKDLTIEAYNEAGQRVLAWRLDRCWPDEFRAHVDPDGGDNTTVIESLTLLCEGIEGGRWERERARAGRDGSPWGGRPGDRWTRRR
ncbi:MAG: phage tail protein [bacterium]